MAERSVDVQVMDLVSQLGPVGTRVESELSDRGASRFNGKSQSVTQHKGVAQTVGPTDGYADTSLCGVCDPVLITDPVPTN